VQPVRDRSRFFSLGLGISWGILVGVPLVLSMSFGQLANGLPLLGLVVWFVLLRVARWLSPAARVDALLRKGRPDDALAICERALAIDGPGAWEGTRRLVWLNRRTLTLISLGRVDEALAAALDALTVFPDPETVGNCALALLRLNRHDEAAAAARLALSLTTERSVLGHTVLAEVMLACGKPAEAEALARAALEDVRSLLPYVRPDHYVLSLAALSRALRLEGRRGATLPAHRRLAAQTMADLRRAATRHSRLRAVAFLEAADELSAEPEERTQAGHLVGLALDADRAMAYWYVTQPGTLEGLHDDERYAQLSVAAKEWVTERQIAAPALDRVALALVTARQEGRRRPILQSSPVALASQIATHAGTIALLLLWTWRFFLSGG
jgi:tetratricopeptide (TPR) repeat protein